MNALVGAHAVRRGEDGLLKRGTFDEDGANLGGEAAGVGALHAALHAVAALVRARETEIGAYIDVEARSDATAMTAWLPIVLQRNAERITNRAGMAARSDGEMTGSRYEFYETGGRPGGVVRLYRAAVLGQVGGRPLGGKTSSGITG